MYSNLGLSFRETLPLKNGPPIPIRIAQGVFINGALTPREFYFETTDMMSIKPQRRAGPGVHFSDIHSVLNLYKLFF